MPGGKGNIKPEDNTNGFQKNPQNINSTGLNKKVSIKGEIEKLLQSDGTVMYSGDQIVEIGEDNGEKFVKIKVPTQEALANKMVKIAMGKDDRVNTLRALTQLLEQFDGKATQKIETEEVNNENQIKLTIKGKGKKNKLK